MNRRASQRLRSAGSRAAQLVALTVAGVLVLASDGVAAKPKKSVAKEPIAKESPAATAAPSRAEVTQGSGPVLQLTIDGMISPATGDYIHEGMAAARARNAQALLIVLDTPGGLLDATKSIVKEFLGSSLPIIVYVGPSGSGATSAGVFITMAAHVAAMAPGTNIGAAHPVSGGGEDIGKDMREKVENFTASLSRTIAQKRGRNAEWAEQAVRKSVSITESEALELKVVDLIARDVKELLQKIDGREIAVEGGTIALRTASAVVERHEMRLRQRILSMLADPNIFYLLMMAGILGLYVEFTHPGVFFPGIAGAICLLLAFAAMQVLPVNYSGLALIGLGVALLIAEIFTPSFGILGLGGLTAFVLGSLLLFDAPDPTLVVDRTIIGAAALTLAGISLMIGWLVMGAQRRRPLLGIEAMIGTVGQVRRVLPAGRVKVFLRGEYWDADSEEPLDIGDTAEVVGAEGMRIRVRRAVPRTR